MDIFTYDAEEFAKVIHRTGGKVPQRHSEDGFYQGFVRIAYFLSSIVLHAVYGGFYDTNEEFLMTDCSGLDRKGTLCSTGRMPWMLFNNDLMESLAYMVKLHSNAFAQPTWLLLVLEALAHGPQKRWFAAV
jgi:hypothetical protein